MYILAIESASSVASACITRDGRVIAQYTTDTGKTHSTTLLLMIEEVFKAAQLTVSDMDCIAVSAGPGSYTGLRIGVATAKGLAFADDIRCVGVSSLEALAMNVATEKVLICPVSDARRDRVFCGLYEYVDGKMQAFMKDCVLETDELISRLKEFDREIIFLGDATEIIREKVNDERFIFAPMHLRMPDAKGVAAAALVKAREGETVSADELLPEYLTQSQAERNRFRQMESKDIETVARIEKESIDNPWSDKSFEESLKNPDAFFAVCESGGSVKGYAGMYISGEEAEITNVAVDKDFRHGGIGDGIVKYLIEQGNDRGVKTFILEVRKSNTPAISLYEKIGFERMGERKDFYNNPKEDGIVMRYDD